MTKDKCMFFDECNKGIPKAKQRACNDKCPTNSADSEVNVIYWQPRKKIDELIKKE